MTTMSPKTTILVAVVLVIAGLALMGLSIYRNSGNNLGNLGNEALGVEQLREMDVPGVHGSVSLWEDNKKVTVSIDLIGVPSDSEYRAYIHDGLCGDEGVVVYDLNPVKGGLSDTILDVSYNDLKKSDRLTLSIDLPDAEGRYVACGEVIWGEDY